MEAEDKHADNVNNANCSANKANEPNSYEPITFVARYRSKRGYEDV